MVIKTKIIVAIQINIILRRAYGFLSSAAGFFLLYFSKARKTSSGTAKTMVFDWSELMSLIDCKVLK